MVSMNTHRCHPGVPVLDECGSKFALGSECCKSAIVGIPRKYFPTALHGVPPCRLASVFGEKMIGLLQRVSQASVTVAGQTVGSIDAGLLVLIGIEQRDAEPQALKLLNKLLDFRVFADEQGRMNRSLRQSGGGLLLVPQFTLVADTDKGLRPSFARGAKPAHARPLFERMVELAAEQYSPVSAGVFGADMRVMLVNDGPVTFSLSVC